MEDRWRNSNNLGMNYKSKNPIRRSGFHRDIARAIAGLAAELAMCEFSPGVDYEDELREAEHQIRQLRGFLRGQVVQKTLKRGL